jgi:mRNA interferase RelE/StbE
MKVEFDKSFERSLGKINDRLILKRIEKTILVVENSENLSSIPNIKKLTGFKRYFRLKIGDYRIGIELVDDQCVRFIIVTHRKDIYKQFP